MPLSPRHQAFARAVADGASFAAAARKAGYAEANARHQGAALIRNAEIQDLVHALLAEREAERSEEVAVLVEHLYRLLDLSMRQVAIKEALACIREIAKLRGLYPARPRTSQPLPEPEVTPTNPHAVEEEEETAEAATPTYPHAVEDVDDAPEPEPSAPETAPEPEAAPGPVLLDAAPLTFPGYAPAEPREPATPPKPAAPEIDPACARAGAAYR